MISTRRAVRSALVAAGALAMLVGSSAAEAQRTTPRIGSAGAPPNLRSITPTVPYPGATVTVEPGWYRQPSPGSARRQYRPGRVVYVPVPVGYGAQGGYGLGGGVYDSFGRPLYAGYDEMAASRTSPAAPIGTPDLSGSPYAVVGGGVMVVDFGNNDRRAVPACAAESSERTPDGQARTIFYRPGYGVVLRAGQRGRVLGTPAAGAKACYTLDQYGRMTLEY
jgi:hypothetical protein